MEPKRRVELSSCQSASTGHTTGESAIRIADNRQADSCDITDHGRADSGNSQRNGCRITGWADQKLRIFGTIASDNRSAIGGTGWKSLRAIGPNSIKAFES